MNTQLLPFSILAALVAFLVLPSCATLTGGSTTTVEIDSTIPGIPFGTSSGLRGRTPATVALPNGSAVTITYMDARGAHRYVSETRMSPHVLGNIVFGGLIGLLIDITNPQTRIHGAEIMLVVEGLPREPIVAPELLEPIVAPAPAEPENVVVDV